MLMRLGRWLRAAGHDVRMFPPGTPDAVLLAAARREARMLITRDRRMPASHNVLVLGSNGTDACARELARRAGIDWLYRPFSRCLLCNRPLQAGDCKDLEQVPPESRRYSDRTWRCEHCRRLYWYGSHTRRMLLQLQTWDAVSHRPAVQRPPATHPAAG